MTKKKGLILQSALELFSNEGFHATSTSKVAKHAGVSEGLVFRHFNSKEKLIQHILKLNTIQIASIFEPILEEEDPKQIIKKVIELPFNAHNENLVLWRLYYKFIWEFNHSNLKITTTLEDTLTKVFTQLKYKRPQLETELLMQIFRSLMESRLLGVLQDKKDFKEFLIHKYHIN